MEPNRFRELVDWFKAFVNLSRMANVPGQEFQRLAWMIRHDQALTMAEQHEVSEFIDELVEAVMQAAWEEFYKEG